MFIVKTIKKPHIILIFYTVIMKFFHSFNSPRFDDFSIYSDNAIFYGIGKAIVDGRVLYKDIFDHKTPYIYFANALAALFPYRHIGLFVIECVLFYISIIFTYKIIILFKNDKKLALFAVIVMGFFLSSSSITLGIVRTEAYAVACIMPSLYIYLKYLFECNGNYKEFKLSDIFIVGICATITLMTNIRASILFVPFGITLILLLIKNGYYKNLFYVITFGILSILITLLPYIIYMVYTNSFKDMVYAVFHINSIYANTSASVEGLPRNMFMMVVHYIEVHPFMSILNILIFLSIWLNMSIKVNGSKKNDDNNLSRYIGIPALVSYFICLIYIIFSNRVSSYYNVIFAPFLLSIFLFDISVFSKNTNSFKIIYICISVFLLLLNFYFGYYTINKRYEYNKRIGNEMIERIHKAYPNLENKKVLSMGFSPEVYFLLDSKCDFKFFIVPCIKKSFEPKPYKEQYRYVMEEKPDIVILRPDFYFDEYDIVEQKNIKNKLFSSYKSLGQIETNNATENYNIFVKSRVD